MQLHSPRHWDVAPCRVLEKVSSVRPATLMVSGSLLLTEILKAKPEDIVRQIITLTETKSKRRKALPIDSPFQGL